METTLYQQTKNFIYNNKHYIILAVVILFAIILAYYFSSDRIVRNKVKKFEDNYLNQNIVQKDYCHNDIKYNMLCDYYVKSSSKSFLVGFQKFGYTNLNIIKKLLYIGVRYIEINIFSKTYETFSEPIIVSGDKLGEKKASLNHVDVKEFFQLIEEMAFSEKYINNYKDPLFIFLNLKTENVDTLDKVHDIILNTINQRLLPSKYGNIQKDIGTITLCEMMGKCVILSSDGYGDSKLKELINGSTTQPSLKRITNSELDDIIDKKQRGSIQPDFSISSGYIEFGKGNQNDFIHIKDDSINFIEYGITPDFTITVSGAKNGSNNTEPGDFYSVKYVTTNKIFLVGKDIFKEEKPGNEILIRGFNNKHSLEKLEDRNKYQITIVVPDDGLLSKNYDVFKAMSYGCQFVSLYYHNIDEYAKKYNNFFGNSSYKLKPKVLRKIVKPRPKESIFKMFPDPVEENPLPIDYEFSKTYSEVFIKPYLSMESFWVNKNNMAIISPNKTDASIKIEPGLNSSQKNYSISFKQNNKYLVATDYCCYLLWMEQPTSCAQVIDQFKKASTFYPISPFCNKEGYHSFVIAKDKEYNLEKDEDYDGADYSKIYYIRYRPQFDPNLRLYTYQTTFYVKILTIDEPGIEKMTIWRPTIRDRYYPIGDIIKQGIKSPKSQTALVGGATAPPSDYELVYDNKLINQSYEISIWKPIPPDGYIALGYVFNNNYEKPSIDEVRCVASEFTKQERLSSDKVWSNKRTDGVEEFGSTLSFWKIDNKENLVGADYVVVNTSDYMPSEFDTPIFSISTDSKDLFDRLYLEKFSQNKSNTESACFKVIDSSVSEDQATDKAVNIIGARRNVKDNKIISYRASDEGSDMCVSINVPQWEKNLNNKDIYMEKCRDREYKGTNFTAYGDDTIRFNKDPRFCITRMRQDGQNNDTYQEFPAKLTRCEKNNYKQKFYIHDNGFIENMNENGLNGLCLTNDARINESDDLSYGSRKITNVTINTCEKSKKNVKQRWMMKKAFNDFCLEEGSMVYILLNYPRSNNALDTIYIDERIDEVYDFDNFELYMRGSIEEMTDNEYKINLTFKDPSQDTDTIITEPINSIKIVSDKIPNEKSLTRGTEVICRNGNYDGDYLINEDHVKWKGIIVEKISRKKFKVLFSINSLELRSSKVTPQTYGRPRYLQEKLVNISDIRLIKKIPSCYIGNYADRGNVEINNTSDDPLYISGHCGELDPINILGFLNMEMSEDDDLTDDLDIEANFKRSLKTFANKVNKYLSSSSNMDTILDNIGEKLKLFVDKNVIKQNVNLILQESDYFNDNNLSEFMRVINYLNDELN